jgi:hypothetical protein
VTAPNRAGCGHRGAPRARTHSAVSSKDEYFNNPINNALITEDVIRTFARDGISSNPSSANTPTSGRSKAAESRNPSRLVRILVMDDIVGTQRTFTQLMEYLRKRLGQLFDSIELRFVFLFTPRPETPEPAPTGTGCARGLC